MKYIYSAALLSVTALAACDNDNPFKQDNSGTTTTPTATTTPEGTGGTGITPSDSLVRYEERNDNGGGYAENFAYDSATDTFTVDNLAFDGEGPYTRGTAVSDLGPNNSYMVYDAEVTVPDFLNSNAVQQIANYRAIVGVSGTQVNGEPRTSFAIVRTGGYRDFGFGGFVYEREGGVVLPSTGQARYSGDYAGMRIFSGTAQPAGGMEFTQGDMVINIDFADPNAGDGIRGVITNRQAFDINGTPVTLGINGEAGELALPPITFTLNGVSGNLNSNGELTGPATSAYVNSDGDPVNYENGTYYGIIAGDATDAADGGEIVGVLVVESTDPRFEGTTVQETGGFILLRQ